MFAFTSGAELGVEECHHTSCILGWGLGGNNLSFIPKNHNPALGLIPIWPVTCFNEVIRLVRREGTNKPTLPLSGTIWGRLEGQGYRLSQHFNVFPQKGSLRVEGGRGGVRGGCGRGGGRGAWREGWVKGGEGRLEGRRGGGRSAASLYHGSALIKNGLQVLFIVWFILLV